MRSALAALNVSVPAQKTFGGPQCCQDTQDDFQSLGPCEWPDYEMLADRGGADSRHLRAPTWL